MFLEGAADGVVLGAMEGRTTGYLVGCDVITAEGLREGVKLAGGEDGCRDDTSLGFVVGLSDGDRVGTTVGQVLGKGVGTLVGAIVGPLG